MTQATLSMFRGVSESNRCSKVSPCRTTQKSNPGYVNIVFVGVVNGPLNGLPAIFHRDWKLILRRESIIDIDYNGSQFRRKEDGSI